MEKVLFDEDCYGQLYSKEATRADQAQAQKRPVNLIYAYIDYLQIELKTSTDLGCGLGTFLNRFKILRSDLQSTGIKVITQLF